MNLGFDLTYALRMLKKSWGYSLMCASVVALSVGLVVFSYSLVYSQLLKPLGFPGSERWYSVQIAAQADATALPSVRAYTYQELLKQNRSVDHLGAFVNRSVILSEGQASTTLRAAAISPRLLAATKAPLLLGRMFDDTDGQPGAAPVAILSFNAWHDYFAADASIIGKTARIDAAPVQIVGVMPKSFFMLKDFEVWFPLQLPNLAQPRDSAMTVSPLIALGDHQSVESVMNEMKTAIDGVNHDYPELFNSTRHAMVFPALRMYTHYQTPIVLMVAFMAAALLLLGCVNISMVFLARLLERSRELALRTALGASHSRVLRQCLLETVPIILVGLAAGWGLAFLGIRWAEGVANFSVQTLAYGTYPNLLVLRPVDLMIAVISSMVIWLLSTLVPAWRIAKQDAAVTLAGSGKGASVRSSNRSVGLLVGLQVVVSSLVLVTCGNMVLAVAEEVAKPSGLDTAQIMLSTYPTVFDARYTETPRRLRYWEDLTSTIESKIPGAEAAFTTTTPTSPISVDALIETQQGTEHQGTLKVPLAVVSDNYFKLMGISLRSGRLFDSTDNDASLKVAVVDEKMAARYWPNQDVVGKRVQLDLADLRKSHCIGDSQACSQYGETSAAHDALGNRSWVTIVGVVSAIAGEPYVTDNGIIYHSIRQAVPPEFQLLVKLPNTTTDNRAALRAAAFEVDRDLPLHNLQMLDVYMAALNLRWTTLVQTFGVIALITAVLAASGLFGLITRSVVQRTQEVGLRRALGATSWRATSMFLRQGALYLSVAIAGIALGTVLVPLMSAVIPNILDRVVMVTLGVIFLIATVILAASYLPTRRAVILEPGDALRYE